MLGHSSITISADTYMSPLSETDPAIAESVARLVPRARAASGNIAPETESKEDTCRMVLFCRKRFGRDNGAWRRFRSRKRPRTSRPRPSRTLSWGRNPKSER